MENTVSLQISKDLVNPIVETKVKEAILAAMGGQEKIIEKVVNEVLSRRVDENGKHTNNTYSDKFSWLDVVVTKQIREAVETQVKDVVAESSIQIREAVIKQLQSKKGSSMVAAALVDCLSKTFASSWTSKFDVKFESPSTRY